jgi:transcriptional regulator with GAF, ATPase, and Fis domain
VNPANRDKPNVPPQPGNVASASERLNVNQGFRACDDADRPTTHPITVLGWEWSDSRWATIADVCAACGARAYRLNAVEDIRAARKLHSFEAALVALHERPDTSSACLTVISHLKDFGLKVIAYEQGLDSWPVSARCRALLAGAKYLLDSADANFRKTLLATLRELLAALHQRRGEETVIRNLARSHGIVGVSESLMDSFRQIIRASKLSDLPVLITGESGTGKELFASALHALDPKRCDHPFVPINCAAISAGVAESELFGHVKGAFTGASQDHRGYFLAARGGVLFLDEIGELGLDVQAKILRVLQERRFFRVGAAQEIAVDIRIVAATNRDLSSMVRAGRFREDLFHRLNSLAIGIAPLRERREDLQLLVEHFVPLHQSGRERTEIGADLIDALGRLQLGGNVRELRNIIIAALAAKPDAGPLGLKDLPHRVWEEVSATEVETAADTPEAKSTGEWADSLALSCTRRQGWRLDRCLAECEQEIIKAALQYTKNNQSRAARLLGITPRSIYNKLRKYEIAGKAH